MGVLNEKQIQFGFTYHHKEDEYPKDVVEVSEYNKENALTINCTQLEYSLNNKYKSPKEKQRVVEEWCVFLASNPELFTELRFDTKMPQELFNAVCQQKNLKKLYIKWGSYSDISKIANLTKLEYLHIGTGASVKSIESIAELKNLVALSLENFQKIEDYSCLKKIKKLESLTIEGDGLSLKSIKVVSIDFLREMQQLRFFRFLTVRLLSKDYTPILHLKNLEHLTLIPCKEVKKLYEEFIQLKYLKYGLLKDNPELYRW